MKAADLPKADKFPNVLGMGPASSFSSRSSLSVCRIARDESSHEKNQKVRTMHSPSLFSRPSSDGTWPVSILLLTRNSSSNEI